MYYLFIDESGNTGNPKILNDKWNFEDQKYFALGGICLNENSILNVRQELSLVFKKYGFNETRELKSRGNLNLNLLKDILEILKNSQTYFFADISNKKYKIVTILVDYCVYPYYMYKSEDIRDFKCQAAIVLYYNLDDYTLAKFVEICTNDIAGNPQDAYDALKEFLYELQKKVIDKEINKAISKVIDFSGNYKEKSLTIRNLYPLQDRTNKNTPMAFLPNLDAFLNLINVISYRISNRSKEKMIVCHDNQEQFSNSFFKWIKNMKDEFSISNIDHLEFQDSKNEILIQCADYITGSLVKYLKNSIDMKGDKTTRNLGEILKTIIGESCNLVGVKSEQIEFFGKYKKSPVIKRNYNL